MGTGPVSRSTASRACLVCNSAIFEAMYVSSFQASLAEPASSAYIVRYRATRSSLASPDYFRGVNVLRDSARPKGLGDELERHFMKHEGVLIDYPCNCTPYSRTFSRWSYFRVFCVLFSIRENKTPRNL